MPDAPLADRIADFYAPALSPSRLRSRPPTGTAPPDLLLRTLDPPDLKIRHIPLLDILRLAYRNLSSE